MRPIDAANGVFELTLPAVRYSMPMGVVSIPAPLFRAQAPRDEPGHRTSFWHMAVDQNQWYHFGVGATPILVYFSGDWFTGGTGF